MSGSLTAATSADGAAGGGAAAHVTRRRGRVRWAVVAVVVLLGLTVLSLALGPHPVSPRTALDALFAPDGSYDHRVVREVRVPRTLLGLLVAAALGVAGALMQAFTRNPLADPGILGVNAGAGVGVTVAAVVLGLTTFLDYVWFAFAGAFAATVLVYVVGSRGPGGGTPLRMTLTGVALGSVLGGVGSAIDLAHPSAFGATRFWSIGTINVQDGGLVLAMTPFLVTGLLAALVLAHQLNAMALGDDLARSFGTRLGPLRVAVVTVVTVLCGAATAATGPIGFVGFIVPHVARWFVGPDQRWIVAYSALLAPSLLLGADLAGRLLLPGGQLPVGLVTVAVGAPLVILLVRRGTVSGL